MPLAKPRNPADHPAATDRFIQAGERAEAQMAYDLDRAFGHMDSGVALFHDLRLVFAPPGEDPVVAQLDHLLVHPFGFIVIESKSVAEGIEVNAQGEFIRVHGGRKQAMDNPIHQAREQMVVLRRMLAHHAPQLLDKMLMGTLQKGFGGRTWEVLVAVSGGMIDRHSAANVPELFKADMIVSQVRKRLEEYKAKGGIRSFLSLKDDSIPKFTNEELERVCAFLVMQHTPRRAAPVRTEAGASATRPPAPVREASPKPAPAQAAASATGAPQCPRCGKEMVVRETKKGENIGRKFWGCSEYGKTKCSGKRPAEEWPLPVV